MFHTKMFRGIWESEWNRIEGVVASEQHINGKAWGKPGQEESGPGPETKTMAKTSSSTKHSSLDVV